MFLRCSYFLAKSEAGVLINSVPKKRKACIGHTDRYKLIDKETEIDEWTEKREHMHTKR